jgi:hypothetical protein
MDWPAFLLGFMAGVLVTSLVFMAMIPEEDDGKG